MELERRRKLYKPVPLDMIIEREGLIFMRRILLRRGNVLKKKVVQRLWMCYDK